MSIQYTLYLAPDAAHFRYRPEPELVGGLVNKLAAAGWLTAGQNQCAVKVYSDGLQRESVLLSDLPAKVRDVFSASATLDVELPLEQKRAESLFGDMPPGTALGQQYCQWLQLLVCGTMAMVAPDNMVGSLLPCPHCGGNLAESGLPVEENFIPDIEKHLAVCPMCDGTLTLEQLSGSSPNGIDAAPKPEAVPFFRLALCMTSGASSQDPPPADPDVLKMLTETFGLGFRRIGRWS